VLVRLENVGRAQLRGLLAQAHAVTLEKKKSRRPAAKRTTAKKSCGAAKRCRDR
jgi:hypothetical protein